jgi:hypothetical protein
MGTQFQSALPLTRSSFKRRRSKPACAGKPCHRIERKCATASLIAKLSRETTMEIVANGLPSITARSRVPSRCLQNVSGGERATVKLPRDPASGPFALHGSRTRTHCRLRLRTEWMSLLPRRTHGDRRTSGCRACQHVSHNLHLPTVARSPSCSTRESRGITIWPKMLSSASATTGRMSDEALKKPA